MMECNPLFNRRLLLVNFQEQQLPLFNSLTFDNIRYIKANSSSQVDRVDLPDRPPARGAGSPLAPLAGQRSGLRADHGRGGHTRAAEHVATHGGVQRPPCR